MRKLVGRIEHEGVRGLSSMCFWRDARTGRLGAVITFVEPNDFVPHVEMLSTWSEFSSFTKMVRLVSIRVHGRVPVAIKAFIAKFGGEVSAYEELVVGFRR
jgi:hypothetical protein